MQRYTLVSNRNVFIWSFTVGWPGSWTGRSIYLQSGKSVHQTEGVLTLCWTDSHHYHKPHYCPSSNSLTAQSLKSHRCGTCDYMPALHRNGDIVGDTSVDYWARGELFHTGFVQALKHCFPGLTRTCKDQILGFYRTQKTRFQGLSRIHWLPAYVNTVYTKKY